ncbi:hypothetical protein [Piscinibacter sp.]|uniref:hypothetical protein n=1 Tax=Piscinibacter sp. TaxID=1903157 RepID=UPI002C434C47|nr:hypothetical protein [Albitalea sp.]HUG24987.1 hypothetical protein [Albitalea sp.]
MNPLSHSPARWAALAALLATSTTFAQGGNLLRDASAPASSCVVASDATGHALAVPGPYAKYLIHHGMSKERALQAARTIDAAQAAAYGALDRPAAAAAHAAAVQQDHAGASLVLTGGSRE